MCIILYAGVLISGKVLYLLIWICSTIKTLARVRMQTFTGFYNCGTREAQTTRQFPLLHTQIVFLTAIEAKG